MKLIERITIFSVICLFLFTLQAYGDTINVQNLMLNQSGLITRYDSMGLYAYGLTSAGDYVYFGGILNPSVGPGYVTGFLDAYTSGFTLQGNLTHVTFANGMFEGQFIGHIIQDGVTTGIFHATLYEPINLQTNTVGQGYLVIRTVVPEPSEIALMITGLVGIFARRALV